MLYLTCEVKDEIASGAVSVVNVMVEVIRCAEAILRIVHTLSPSSPQLTSASTSRDCTGLTIVKSC